MNHKQAYFRLSTKYDINELPSYSPETQLQFIVDYEELRINIYNAFSDKERESELLGLNNLIKSKLGEDIFSRLSSVGSISNPLRESA